MTRKFFKGEIKDLRELKKEYYRMAKIYHPDFGGSEKDMKELINEYEKLFELLKNEKTTETKYNFPEALQKIINIPGIEIEIIGDWIWVGGDTKPVKDQLSAAGFRYAGKRKMWYWKSYPYRKRSKRHIPTEELRNIYGSQQVKGRNEEKKEERKKALLA
jgi:hypothetical protein